MVFLTGYAVLEKIIGNGIGIMGSRDRLCKATPEECKKYKFNSSGVYLLVGDYEVFDKPRRIYIGEAGDVFERLKQHYNSSKTDFWEQTVIFSRGRR